MALARQHQTTVGTSATALPGTEYPGWILKNTHATETLYLGDSSVTASTGFPVEAGDIFSPGDVSHSSLRGLAADQLYGIVSSGTVDVRVLILSRVNP